jgi:cation diffusion facilitator family transporter
MEKKPENIIRLQFLVLLSGIVLMAIKFVAHLITGSNAILSDALESIINVAAGFFALYSLWLSKQPKDENHPYGHGKIEFISAGFEGGMIVLAAIYILFEAVHSFINPTEVKQLDIGIYLVAFSGAVNFIMGILLVKAGKRNKAEAMVADGKHLMTDTYTSMGLVLGLVLVQYTHMLWLDGIIAMLMGCMILVTGYQLLRKSLAGLMDETDPEIIADLLIVLNQNRKTSWIDMHNLRVVKYGANYHMDAHITLPWYWSLEEAHEEVSAVDRLVADKFHKDIELFLHADPCIPTSCSICELSNCAERKQPFQTRMVWDEANLLSNKKHQI